MNIDEKDIDRKTALFYAVEEGYVETAKILLDAGANPNVKCGNDEDTMLCVAARLSRSELVELLLQYHAAINEPNTYGNFPLMLGILSSNKDICQQLLDHNANVDQHEHLYGSTALMQAPP
jgi:ankyrin repeat protein